LIHWSEDGEYFLILDEEAFSKTLIPRFWKHDNYASFVRQLNMYGFHKLVGLGDNSMKASESKMKQPSRYKNAYFKRGRPDLLWLIQKTTKQAASNRKGDAKQEEENQQYPSGVSAGNNSSLPSKRKVEVDEDTLSQIKKEVADLRKQNVLITSVINKLRKQDFAISQQALQFSSEQQRMQQRHQQQLNSLNAITSFLYNIFNNRLEGDPNARASFDNMLRTMLPSAASSGVVEVQDMPTELANYNYNLPLNNQTRSSTRRPLLLTGPESGRLFPDASGVTELPQTPTPRVESVTPQGVQEDVMTFLNPNQLASAPPNASTPLELSNGLGAQSRRPTAANAQAVPTPSPPQSAPTGVPLNALSPRNQQSPFPPPIPNPPNSQEHLNLLERLQSEQSKRVQSLAEKLGPLSPNGHIPGIHDSSNIELPDEFDFDQWLNNNNDSVYNFDPANFDLPDPSSGELFPKAESAGGIDFADFGGTAVPGAEADSGAVVDGAAGHKRVQSVSSRAGSPGSVASPATIETILEGETPVDEVPTATSSPAPARKRRRNN
jgi:heat shock transcription factor